MWTYATFAISGSFLMWPFYLLTVSYAIRFGGPTHAGLVGNFLDLVGFCFGLVTQGLSGKWLESHNFDAFVGILLVLNNVVIIFGIAFAVGGRVSGRWREWDMSEMQKSDSLSET